MNIAELVNKHDLKQLLSTLGDITAQLQDHATPAKEDTAQRVTAVGAHLSDMPAGP